MVPHTVCKEHAIVGWEQSWVMHAGCAHWQLARCSLPKPSNFLFFAVAIGSLDSWALCPSPGELMGTRARHRDLFSWMSRETMQHLTTAHKMDFTHDHHLSNIRHRRKTQLCKSLITNAWSWTLDAFLVYCIALRISPKSASAVDFSAVTNIYPHAAHALLHPTKN